MSTKKIYLGTTEHTQNVPAPASGMRKTMTRTRISPTFLNGGAAVFGSAAARAEYAMDFGVQDPTDAEGLWKYNDFANGAHGNGFIYMHDPMIADQNVLGPQWANPALIEQGWKNICGQRIGFVPVDDNITRLMMTNLAAYGSFETAQSGTTEVRRNNHQDPLFSSNRAAAVNGATVVGHSAEYNFGQGRGARVTTPVGGSIDSGISINGTSFAPLANASYMFSVAIRAITAVSLSTYTSGVNSQRGTLTLAAGEIGRIYVRVNTPSSIANTGTWYLLRTDNTVASTFDVGEPLIEQTDQRRPFFCGGSPNEKGFTTEWAGTANASASIMRAAVVTVRENLATDPLGVNPANWATAGGVDSASTAVTDFPGSINTAVRATTTSSSAAVVLHRFPAVAPGTQITMKMRIRVSGGQISNVTATHRPQGQIAGETQANLAQASYGPGVYDIAATLTTSATTTNTANGIGLRWATSSLATPGGVTVDMTAMQIEVGSTAGEFFSGATPNFSDFITAWTGTANASTSVQQGIPAPAHQVVNAVAILSWEWCKFGNTSLRIIPTGPTGNTYIELTPAILAAAAEYTILATARLAAPQTGTLGATPRAVRRVGVGDRNVQAPNQAGEHQLQLINNGGGTRLLLFNGASQGNGDVWWDALTVVEGNYPNLTQFDGSSTNPNPDLNYVWTGTPFASTSEFRETLHPQPGLAPKTALWEIPTTVPARTMQSGKNRSFTVPLPPGHTLHLGGAKGSATFNAGIYYDVIPVGSTTWQYGGEVVLGSPVDLPSFATKINGDQFRFVRIYVGRGTTNATGYLYLNALMGQVLESGRVPAVDRYLAGQGVSGMLFSNEATPQNYIMAKGRKRVGLSTTLLEVEQWMNPR